MPNWCSTNVTINCRDEDEAKKLYDLIEDWTSSDKMENGFGHKWLGNVVLGAGVGTVDSGEDTDVRCRGNIVYMDYKDESVSIDTETAWAPILKLWQLVVKKYAPGAKIIYIADECGSEIYVTNDPCVVGTYHVDIWDDDVLDRIGDYDGWEMTRDGAKEILKRVLQTDENDFDTLLSRFDEEDFGSVQKWEYADISEWD